MATSAEELTNCVICTEIFTDPQVLPCDHVFCKGCVNKLRNGGTVKCPKCCKVCVNDDVKPDFRLATFLDALATTTEKLTRLSSSSVITDDVTQQHVTPPAGDKCESCEENVIDSFCHQCQQWFCKSCKKVRGKMKATKHHTYTVLAEMNQQLKTDMVKSMTLLKQKREELKTKAKFYESIIKELKTTQTNALDKSDVLRKTFHGEIDKYFNTINHQIAVACITDLTAFESQSQATIVNMQACADLTAKMDNLIAKTDSELLPQGAQLLSQAKRLSQALDDSFIDAVEVPQVRFERGQDWSLEGAVNLQLRKVQRRQA